MKHEIAPWKRTRKMNKMRIFIEEKKLVSKDVFFKSLQVKKNVNKNWINQKTSLGQLGLSQCCLEITTGEKRPQIDIVLLFG